MDNLEFEDEVNGVNNLEKMVHQAQSVLEELLDLSRKLFVKKISDLLEMSDSFESVGWNHYSTYFNTGEGPHVNFLKFNGYYESELVGLTKKDMEVIKDIKRQIYACGNTFLSTLSEGCNVFSVYRDGYYKEEVWG